jgi:hypothetical protein
MTTTRSRLMESPERSEREGDEVNLHRSPLPKGALRWIVAGLEELCVEELSRTGLTEKLTHTLQMWLSDCGWTVLREYPVRGWRFPGSPGFLDLLAACEDERIAIEIDRTNKQRSVAKLNFVQSRYGALPVWVRWQSGFSLESVPSSIVVIELKPGEVCVHNRTSALAAHNAAWKLPDRLPISHLHKQHMARKYWKGRRS